MMPESIKSNMRAKKNDKSMTGGWRQKEDFPIQNLFKIKKIKAMNIITKLGIDFWGEHYFERELEKKLSRHT